MNRSYTLNSVCPKIISNKPVFRKIGVRIFEVLLYTKSVHAKDRIQTPDLLEKLAESLLYSFIVKAAYSATFIKTD